VDRTRLIRNITPTGTPAGSHPRLTGMVVAAELVRLTPRDRHLLDLLAEHQTLTTDQLCTLAFTSVGRARNRLNTLHDRQILDRFRHYQRPGSQSWRWTLGPVGAAILAAAHGQAPPRPSAVREATARLALSPRLDHLLAVNGFFVALTGHARSHPDTRLARWWNETRCRDACGRLARPDGHGVWVDGGRTVPFWLEVDQGSEPLRRVAAKLPGYAALGAHRAHPVLFWLPGTARESNLHAHLARTGVPDEVIVATAADNGGGPAGPVWRPVGQAERVSLADLATPTGHGVLWDG
jgi:hypothetical protein